MYCYSCIATHLKRPPQMLVNTAINFEFRKKFAAVNYYDYSHPWRAIKRLWIQRVHPHRVARGNRYHCYSCGDAPAGTCQGKREGATDYLHEQREAALSWPAHVLR